jgi:D-alanyl-D-alanine carboxypeptidase/D-alanyl-D-alanine-endopeptidase (penicillin-binding protein 4)
LSLNFNRVHFEWKRSGSGYTTTMDARSRKYFPAVSVIAMKVGARDYPVYTYAQNGKKEVWNVARGALGKGGARWLPVRKPELYAGDVFRTLASAQGIKMKPAKKMSRLPQSYRLLARYQSVPLAPMLKSMLKYSNNLTAEMVGMAATKARGKAAAGMRNSASAMSAWARDSLGMKHTKLVDHSGLGGGSRMCAGELARALADPVRRDRLEPLLKDIALRDPKGKPLKNHPVKVRAKTGTLNFVSGLAGYVNGPGGQDLAFAIFAADEPARGKIKRADRIRPKGARGWNRRAKSLQQKLIERWHRTFDV